MKIKIVISLFVFLAVLALAGCGHKSSDEGIITPPPTTTPAAPTTGVLKISASGTQSAIGSMDIIVSFPAGVTVDADAATGEAAAGAVSVSGPAAAGSNTLVVAKFTPAAGGASAELRIGLVNPTGFALGECATINFKVDTAADMPGSKTVFQVTTTTVSDVQGNPLNGITVQPLSLATGT